MPFNSITDRTDAGDLIPDEDAQEIIKTLPESSAALSLFKQVRMSTKVRKMPVLSALPVAYWVDGDTGLKQTTELAWKGKNLVAEEIATILPIPEAVLDDSGFPIWEEARPLIVEAIGRRLDETILFGSGAPTSWTDAGLVPKAVAAGNVFARGTNTAAKGGFAQDVSDAFELVENDGFDVDAVIASKRLRGKVRGNRNVNGDQIGDISINEWYGAQVNYALSGGWPAGTSAAEAIYGDPTKAILGTRQDITFKLFTEGVISDDEGNVLLNLMQQDSVAMRVVARFGFAVANPLTRDQPTEEQRYPFGVLRSPAS